ncbi:MAG: hypothetical protein JWL69_1955 [Phycisphaerales bacterium]|nr:hypothetical protein [Phycisphaerales bacterium]MDB5358490.1 hypothetical protein [Phycisphaerales bacterium]
MAGVGLVALPGDSHLSHHRQPRHLLLFLLFAFGSGSAAMGQITKTMREAVDAKPSRPLIDQYIAGQVKSLASDDPKAQKGARESLANEVGSPTVSSSFLDEYADSLNIAVLPLVDGKSKSDVHVRLSAAIAVARVAAKAGNNRLSPAALALVQDKSPAVALWGIKAAKYILPSMIIGLQNPAPMGQAIVDAVKTHSTGAVAEEAYNALLLQPDPNKHDDLRGYNDAVLKPYLAQPLALFEYRVKLYEDFVPPQPVADALGCKFFVMARVWQAQASPQQAQSLQLMLDLLKGAAKQKQTADAAVATELTEVIRQTGGAFEVAALAMKNNALGTAAKALSKINNDTTAGDIDDIINRIETNLK